MARLGQVSNYKNLKEDFVSGHNGGSLGEIVAVSLTLPAAVFLWSALQSRLQFFQPYGLNAFLTDWLINCCSILFAITVYSNHSLLLNGLLLAPALLLAITTSHHPSTSRRPRPPTADQSEDAVQNPLPIKPFVTMYRGSMMVITCAAILAVDFRLFPRRFAKTENWGTSLMDLGVGSFVFSAGVVSARGLLKEQLSSSGRRTGLVVRLVGSLAHSLPLLGLGVVRLVSVKGVDYAEHVTEYGVHWNFFFTLGFLPPFVAVFQSLFRLIPSYAVLAVLLGTAYQLVLLFTPLTEFIVMAPRVGLIAQNREGLASFAGYLAIFLSGQGVGMFTLARDPQVRLQGNASRMEQLKAFRQTVPGKLLGAGLFYSVLFAVVSSYEGFNLPVSRRLANLPYVLWVGAFNSLQLFVCYATEKHFFPNVYNPKNAEEEKKQVQGATSRVLHAFNRNGLAIFLLANLLTGLVNLTLPTITMKPPQTMAVLVSYMAILGGAAVILDMYNITVNLNLNLKVKRKEA